MKKLILIILCLLLTGCISSSVVRGVNQEEKVFYSSSSPNIQIEFPTYAEYQRMGVGQMTHRFSLGDSSVFVHFEPRPANETQVDYYYNPEKWMFSNVKPSEKLTQGTLDVLGKKWYYCNSLSKNGGRVYFIHNRGYFDPSHNTLYLRFVRPLTDEDSRVLLDYEHITNNQYRLMQEIVRAFDYCVKITSFTPSKKKESSTVDSKL